MIHGVGPGCGVGAQPGEQAAERIVLLVDGMIGHQAAILRVQHEDHAHQRRDQSAVEVIRLLPGEISQRSAAARVGCDKAAQQFVERCEHLPGEPRGDLGLRVPALGQQSR